MNKSPAKWLLIVNWVAVCLLLVASAVPADQWVPAPELSAFDEAMIDGLVQRTSDNPSDDEPAHGMRHIWQPAETKPAEPATQAADASGPEEPFAAQFARNRLTEQARNVRKWKWLTIFTGLLLAGDATYFLAARLRLRQSQPIE